MINQLPRKVIRVKAYKSLHVTSMSSCKKIQPSRPVFYISRIKAVLQIEKKRGICVNIIDCKVTRVYNRISYLPNCNVANQMAATKIGAKQKLLSLISCLRQSQQYTTRFQKSYQKPTKTYLCMPFPYLLSCSHPSTLIVDHIECPRSGSTILSKVLFSTTPKVG